MMKVKSLIVLLSILISLPAMAFSPVLTQQTAQDDLPKYGKDSVTCVQNLSLYRESYKQWKASRYKSPSVDHAKKYWNYCFKYCPKSSENIYVDGVKMLDYYIKKASNDEAKQNLLIDTLMMVYDQRIEYFPNHYKTGKSQIGDILGRKGVDLYQLRPSDYLEAYAILSKSLEMDKANAGGPVFVYYFRILTKMAMKGDTDTAAVVDAYDMISDYIAQNIAKYKKLNDAQEVEEYENVQNNIEATFEPFALCPDLVRIYRSKFEANPNDVELLKKIADLLDKKKCIDDPLYFEVIVKLYDQEPSPESAYLIGKIMLKEGKYAESIPYMEDATKMEDTDKVDDAYIYLAESYKSLNNFPKARQMALKAAEMNPGWGQPYVFVGDLYAMSAKECGSDDLTTKVAYWAAVDKYMKAKKVEPDLSDLVNKRIETYQVYFPPTELLFFNDLKEGDSYTVGCWINETTTIRAAK